MRGPPQTRQKTLPAHDDGGPPGRQHRLHGNDIFRKRNPRPRRWLILGTVGLAQLMVVLDSM
jgi:hypothetical protein